MKKIISLALLSTLLLAACGSKIDVATQEIIDAHPELEGPILAWQSLVDAAEKEDCETFLDGMRLSLQLTEESCPDAFAFFADHVPAIDWERTEWNADGGKAKIYEVESGSLTSFILDTAKNKWRADSQFWE